MVNERPITLVNERSLDIITGYHAHIYYDAAPRARAARVREALDRNFKIALGRWRDEPEGPHPRPMYQVAFAEGEFERIVPWLSLNRDGLVVFIHPMTGDDYADHADFAIWLGEMFTLNLDALRKSP